MLPSMFSLSQRCQTDRRAERDDQRHNALGEKINRDGTPAVTIDAALGSGTSEGGEAGVFQHGYMAEEKVAANAAADKRVTAPMGAPKQQNSGEHVTQSSPRRPTTPR